MKLKELYDYLDFLINGIDMEGYDKEKAHEIKKEEQFKKLDKLCDRITWIAIGMIITIGAYAIIWLGGKPW